MIHVEILNKGLVEVIAYDASNLSDNDGADASMLLGGELPDDNLIN